MYLEHYPTLEPTIELPALALPIDPSDQRAVVGRGTVLRKIKGGQVLIGVLAFDQLYLLVDQTVLPFTPDLQISHVSGVFIGKLSIKTGATSILQTRYWKSRSAIVAAIDPVYDHIDDEDQNFCTYLADLCDRPSSRKWVYERYQPAKEPIATLDAALEYLLSRLSPHTPPVFFAEIIDQLSWLVDEQSVNMYRIMRDWLHSDDKEKVKIALSTTEAFFIGSDADDQAAVARIVDRWPDLAPLCNK